MSHLSPQNYHLSQNYPNPFNPVTMIRFDVKEPVHVVLIVHDLLGREVAKLVNKQFQAGTYQIKFDGSELPSGLYFCRIQMGKYRDLKKMILMK